MTVLLASSVVAALVVHLRDRKPRGLLLAVVLLIAAPVVLLLHAAVAGPRAAARRGRPALAPAAWCTTGLLLLTGLGALLGPWHQVVPGAVLMFAATGPLMLLVCLGLLSGGPLLAWRTIPVHRRAAVVLAAVAAPVALTGAVS